MEQSKHRARSRRITIHKLNTYIMAEKTRTVMFSKEKDTKNTVKFTEVAAPGEPTVIGSLYLQKWVAGSADSVKVTLELP